MADTDSSGRPGNGDFHRVLSGSRGGGASDKATTGQLQAPEDSPVANPGPASGLGAGESGSGATAKSYNEPGAGETVASSGGPVTADVGPVTGQGKVEPAEEEWVGNAGGSGHVPPNPSSEGQDGPVISTREGPDPPTRPKPPEPVEPPEEEFPVPETAEVNPGEAPHSHLAMLATQDLAERQGMPANAVRLVSIEDVTWRDASLGNAQLGMAYAQVLVGGYRMVLEANGKAYEYHTSMDRVVLRGPGPAVGTVADGSAVGAGGLMAAGETSGECPEGPTGQQ